MDEYRETEISPDRLLEIRNRQMQRSSSPTVRDNEYAASPQFAYPAARGQQPEAPQLEYNEPAPQAPEPQPQYQDAQPQQEQPAPQQITPEQQQQILEYYYMMQQQQQPQQQPQPQPEYQEPKMASIADNVLNKLAGCGSPHPAAPKAAKQFKRAAMYKTAGQIADEVLEKCARLRSVTRVTSKMLKNIVKKTPRPESRLRMMEKRVERAGASDQARHLENVARTGKKGPKKGDFGPRIKGLIRGKGKTVQQLMEAKMGKGMMSRGEI